MPSRADRRAFERLPVATVRWMVGLVAVPVRVPGVDLQGVLMVVEEGSRRMRAIAPVAANEPLWPTLHKALHEPAPPCVRARPRALVCEDAALEARLRRELADTELRVERVDRLEGFDALVQDLVQDLMGDAAPPSAPTITVEQPRWASTLTSLCRLAPWQELDDGFAFQFGREVPELADAVAVVIGLAGHQEGVVLYPTSAEFLRFRAAAQVGEDALAECSATCLYLDHADSFHPVERAALREGGLALPGDRLPHLAQLQRGEVRAVSERDQRVLLAATEALVDLCARLGDARSTASIAMTCLGPVTIRTAPRVAVTEEPTRASPYAHAVILTKLRLHREERPAEDVEAIVVKLAKRDGERLVREVAGADGLRFEDGRRGLRVRLFSGRVDLGVLCEAPIDRPTVARLRGASTVAIAVCAGGPKRVRFSAADMLWSARLAQRGPAGTKSSARHDPVFDRPVEAWPKASETLMLYARAVFGPIMDPQRPEQILEVLTMASAVWSAVVIADYVGDDSVLTSLQRSTLPLEMIDALVREKRQQWPGDPRIIANVELVWQGHEPRYHASAALPAGYVLGG